LWLIQIGKGFHSQVGKTTLLKHIAKPGRNTHTLDDPLQRRLAIEEPELFLERFAAPVIIDEIQYAPGLLPLRTDLSTAGAMSGAFFETFIVSEIMKSWYNAGKNPPAFYYRDKDRNEIDIILDADGKLYPVKIKKSANPGKDTTEYLPLDAKNSILPWWMV
jgi:predicted AAA+ superfamily ATPase